MDGSHSAQRPANQPSNDQTDFSPSSSAAAAASATGRGGRTFLFSRLLPKLILLLILLLLPFEASISGDQPANTSSSLSLNPNSFLDFLVSLIYYWCECCLSLSPSLDPNTFSASTDNLFYLHKPCSLAYERSFCLLTDCSQPVLQPRLASTLSSSTTIKLACAVST